MAMCVSCRASAPASASLTPVHPLCPPPDESEPPLALLLGFSLGVEARGARGVAEEEARRDWRSPMRSKWRQNHMK